MNGPDPLDARDAQMRLSGRLRPFGFSGRDGPGGETTSCNDCGGTGWRELDVTSERPLQPFVMPCHCQTGRKCGDLERWLDPDRQTWQDSLRRV